MFETATLLTDDFLKAETTLSLPMKPAEKKIVYKEYYLNTCNAIAKLHYLHPTRAQIEEYILTGEFIYDELTTLECPINDHTERVYIFKIAQSKQLQYDFLNGRGAMLSGQEKRFDLCKDATDVIDMLGLYQRTLLCK